MYTKIKKSIALATLVASVGIVSTFTPTDVYASEVSQEIKIEALNEYQGIVPFHSRTFVGNVSDRHDVVTTSFTTSSASSSVVASFTTQRLHSLDTEFSVILQQRVGNRWDDVSSHNFTATRTSATRQAVFRNVGRGTFRVIASSPDTLGASINGTVTYN